mmetsp:Transcript_57649/g.153577  ORF Transcript_57649/g.153577 Transcript_57649/m.153577 type:complete len:374 (-) Transcript_57649:408-1529(-)
MRPSWNDNRHRSMHCAKRQACSAVAWRTQVSSFWTGFWRASTDTVSKSCGECIRSVQTRCLSTRSGRKNCSWWWREARALPLCTRCGPFRRLLGRRSGRYFHLFPSSFPAVFTYVVALTAPKKRTQRNVSTLNSESGSLSRPCSRDDQCWGLQSSPAGSTWSAATTAHSSCDRQRGSTPPRVPGRHSLPCRSVAGPRPRWCSVDGSTCAAVTTVSKTYPLSNVLTLRATSGSSCQRCRNVGEVRQPPVWVDVSTSAGARAPNIYDPASISTQQRVCGQPSLACQWRGDTLPPRPWMANCTFVVAVAHCSGIVRQSVSTLLRECGRLCRPWWQGGPLQRRLWLLGGSTFAVVETASVSSVQRNALTRLLESGRR